MSMNVPKKKIGIAMSGGVDSTACALLTREKYDVQGYFMQLAQPDLKKQLHRVKEVAKKLGIQLHVIDLREKFHSKVLEYFSSSYFNGLTPNPCIICNKEIKFGLFLDAIMSAGMSQMATGHYATILKKENSYRLYVGDDPKKDQSYFLSRLSQSQLANILFPLGKMRKESIYDYVESHGFNDFRGQESQDVCFLENNKIGSFLENRSKTSDSSGTIISTSGQTLGTHKGLYRYTIGQRKGLGISSSSPLYVVGLDTATNSVVVGGNDELFKKCIQVKELHWLAGKSPDLNKQYTVRIRYSHRGSLAKLEITDNGKGEFVFNEPQRAVTPGQFAVVYNDSELLGSAIIE